MSKASSIYMKIAFPLTVAAMLVSVYFYPQEILTTIPLFISCGITVLNVRVSRFGPLAGAINSLLYGVSYALLGLYGNAAYAVLVSSTAQFITFANWSKHPYKGSTVIKRLGAKRFAAVALISAAAWAVLFLILNALGSKSTILDNTTTILGILSTMLFIFPYIEYVYISLISNALSIFMYIGMISESPASITFLIFTVYAFVSTIFTFFNTRAIYKEQQRK